MMQVYKRLYMHIDMDIPISFMKIILNVCEYDTYTMKTTQYNVRGYYNM